MNNYTKFLTDLEKFKSYEIEASERINLKYNINIERINDDYKYDFITSDNITYEVKTDVQSLKSLNYYIEYLFNGKSSGIRTSEADYYIINDTNKYYLIPTQELKDLYKSCNTVTTLFGIQYSYFTFTQRLGDGIIIFLI